MAIFDYKTYLDRWSEEYLRREPVYAATAKAFTQDLRALVNGVTKASNTRVLEVHGSNKSPEKFAIKLRRRDHGDPSQPRYTEPLSCKPGAGVTDLVRARIVTFLIDDLDHFDRLIAARFEYVERIDKAKALVESERFGYQGIHYIVRADPWIPTSDKASLQECVAEIQIRTVLQLGWSEVTHFAYDEEQYGTGPLPAALRRSYQRVAAMLEEADVRLNQLVDETRDYFGSSK
jgi:putative GTP pyrophosphokinase